MKTLQLAAWSLFLVTASVFATTQVLSQDAQPDPLEAGKAMYRKIVMDQAAKTGQHEWMAGKVGAWKGDVTFTTMMGKVKSHMNVKDELLYDGLFVQSTIDGDFMGMEMKGTAWFGYDKNKEKFVEVQISNLGTGFQVLEGTLDEAGKVLTLVGSETTMKTQMGEMVFIPKTVTKRNDDGTMELTRYAIMGGNEQPEMEVTFTKRTE